MFSLFVQVAKRAKRSRKATARRIAPVKMATIAAIATMVAFVNEGRCNRHALLDTQPGACR